MHNLFHDAKVAVVTADTAIDLSGFGSVLLIASAIADPAAAITFTVKEGSTTVFADAAVVPEHQLIGMPASLDGANSVVKIGYLGAKQYLFLTPSAAPDAMHVILSSSANAPVA
ncbi:hypothetical protein [Pseudomonas arsenicoxydans]|uniref:Uncharacterized protein n=1 Tax=Pseudomonas arsenicoxydans TaxID=702115 RepID=A0A502HNE9_9PSED|nr:hypothetical protein [Pseudomonas arsenicoxydans]TPG76319.1 hypothetical protein EAH78_18320 [Pseudomonas arsenicoxydans]